MNKNMITGMIIVGVILLLVCAMFFFQYVSFGKLTFTLQFPDAKGLKAGDTIYLKGVKIGEVKSVAINTQGVAAKVLVDFEGELPVDTVFFIWTDKLISGKKCIQTKLGDDPTLIKKGDTIPGESAYHRILLRVGKKWLESL